MEYEKKICLLTTHNVTRLMGSCDYDLHCLFDFIPLLPVLVMVLCILISLILCAALIVFSLEYCDGRIKMKS
jgi:uncharacterized membrane protein